MNALMGRVIRRATCAWCGGSGDYRGTGYCAGTGQAR